MSDPDSVAIAAGMARYFSPDTSFGDIILYGRQMNPGIFLVFKYVYTALFDSPESVIPFLNAIGVASAVLLPVTLYFIMRLRLGASAAFGAVLIFMFTPLVWESSLSFHPIFPASLLLSIGWLSWRRIDLSTPPGAGWLLLTCLLAASALAIRLELALLAPAFFLAGMLSARRGRILPLLALVASASLFAYWLVVRSLPGSHAEAGKSISDFTRHFLGLWLSNLNPVAMIKTLVWFVFGIGIATILAVAAGLMGRPAGAVRRDKLDSRSLADLAVAALIIVPILALWLPQPILAKLRHYFLLVPALAWLIGDLVLRRLGPRRSMIFASTVVLINLIVPEALYRGWNALNPGNAKTPHGTVFYYRDVISSHIDRYHRMQEGIRAEAMKDAGAQDTDSMRVGPPPAVFVPVNWETYAYTLYGMAQDSSLVKLEEISFPDGIYLHRYDLAGSEVRMVFSTRFTWDVLPEQFVPFLMEAAEEGFAIVIPAELERTVDGLLPSGTDLVPY